MAEDMFAQRQSGRLVYWEAGAGDTVVVIAERGGSPTRAHSLLAENRRVVVFQPPAGAPRQAAAEISAALAALDVSRFDLIGEGGGAAAALRIALAREPDIGSIVLAAPDGAPDAACGAVQRPVLVLCGTHEGPGAAEAYRALLPESHFMFVYDAGRAIGAERPEALAFIAAEFFERRELFLVSRESGVVFP